MEYKQMTVEDWHTYIMASPTLCQRTRHNLLIKEHSGANLSSTEQNFLEAYRQILDMPLSEVFARLDQKVSQDLWPLNPVEEGH